jgi:hypothetical protein
MFCVVAMIIGVLLMSSDSFAQVERISDGNSVSSRDEKPSDERQTRKDTSGSTLRQKTLFKSLNTLALDGSAINFEERYDDFVATVNADNCNKYHLLPLDEFIQAYLIVERDSAIKDKYTSGMGLALRRAEIESGKGNGYADILVKDLNMSKAEAEKIDKETKKEVQNRKSK